jgi:hypothetical protein
VLIAITVMGGLFGLGGMIIAVPVFAILSKYITDKTEARITEKKGEAEVTSETVSDAGSELDFYSNERPEGVAEQSECVALSERFGGENEDSTEVKEP